ncbi:DUF3908 family protein [Planococcus sp. A6]|uniref:DUF3908 family protein n=1 Tax=Planococcus sp. A6 TaxID=2992760 RepID=UPI00237A4DA5|nr:DUF3908 family protein [Planococcus sp. A6]MDE0582226.1 DUF3908 family protein [Planococcus sp. A6]
MDKEYLDERLKELIDHALTTNNFEKFKIEESLKDIFTNDDITFVYPKNVFEEDAESRIFYVLHGEFFSEVKFEKDMRYVSTKPLEFEELRYAVQRKPERHGKGLEIVFSEEESYLLNSNDDCIANWTETYSEYIGLIYAHLLEKKSLEE